MTGPVARTLSIFCNDPANPQQLIFVLATVSEAGASIGSEAAAAGVPQPPVAAIKPPMPEESAQPSAAVKADNAQPSVAPAIPTPPAPAGNPSEITLPDE